MKINSYFYSIAIAATAFTFASCSGDKKEHAHGHDDGHSHDASSAEVAEAADPQFQVDKKFQDQLSVVFASYVDIQEALVSSDAGKVKQEAAETADDLAKVDMKLVTGAAHNDWMAYASPMEAALKEIRASDDIEAQRKSFSALTDNLYKSVKAFGLGGDQAFYAYCPMAFDNEGGYWLTDEAKIQNPYFGDKMLTCGEVKEKLQ